MTLPTYQISTLGNIYGSYGVVQTSVPDLGSAVPFGNGVFLTASHLSESFVDYTHYYNASSMNILAGEERYKFNTFYNLRNFDYRTTNPTTLNTNTVVNDLAAVVQTEVPVPSTNISPILVFADQNSFNKEIGNKKTQIVMSGQSSPDGQTGTVNPSTIIGQFNSSVAAKSGDSGGAFSTNINGSEYLFGITSASYIKKVLRSAHI